MSPHPQWATPSEISSVTVLLRHEDVRQTGQVALQSALKSLSPCTGCPYSFAPAAPLTPLGTFMIHRMFRPEANY